MVLEIYTKVFWWNKSGEKRRKSAVSFEIGYTSIYIWIIYINIYFLLHVPVTYSCVLKSSMLELLGGRKPNCRLELVLGLRIWKDENDPKGTVGILLSLSLSWSFFIFWGKFGISIICIFLSSALIVLFSTNPNICLSHQFSLSIHLHAFTKTKIKIWILKNKIK